MKFRSLALILSLAVAGCRPQPPPDFRVLAEKAYPDGAAPNRAQMDALWTALFKLKQWHFLMSAETTGARQPAVQMIDGEPWLLAFTDLNMLSLYAAMSEKILLDGGAIPDAGPQFDFKIPDSPTAPVVQPATSAPATAPAVAEKTTTKFLGSDGKPRVLSMNTDVARKFLADYKGPPVAGIRFNEGARKGWFAPLDALTGIYGYLSSNGKL